MDGRWQFCFKAYVHHSNHLIGGIMQDSKAASYKLCFILSSVNNTTHIQSRPGDAWVAWGEIKLCGSLLVLEPHLVSVNSASTTTTTTRQHRGVKL